MSNLDRNIWNMVTSAFLAINDNLSSQKVRNEATQFIEQFKSREDGFLYLNSILLNSGSTFSSDKASVINYFTLVLIEKVSSSSFYVANQ